MDLPLPRSFRPVLLALFFPMLLAGCVSTQKRFEKGVKYESSGRYDQAADLYLKVLRKERHHEEARQHLQDTGARIVEARLDEAGALEEVGRYADAVNALARLDALRDRAASVGVSLAVPEDYEAYRQSLASGAVDELFTRAERAEEAGNFADALRMYERLQGGFVLTSVDQGRVDVARARVQLNWAEADLAQGRFRGAFGRTEQLLKVVPPGSEAALRALAIQEEALRAGTRFAAYLPVSAPDSVAEEAPQAFLFDLNEVLRHEHWSRPPLFLAPVDPAHLHQELRRYRSGTRFSREQAAEIGRAVGADFVVVPEMPLFRETEKILKEQRRSARTRGRNPVDTTYVEQQFNLNVHAQLAYRILDPHTRAVLDKGIVEASASDRFTRGYYLGDPRSLDLSGSARGLFDGRAHQAEEDALYEEVMDGLALDLSHRVYEELLRRVP